MNDEQRCMACFGAQPEGTGPFFCGAALHLAYVHPVHCTQCAVRECDSIPEEVPLGYALPRKKMAIVAVMQ